MVRIHNIGPSRKSLMQSALGESIGKGLANFTNQYFAGKALDDVINDPDYESAPMSERASRLERSMSRYGDYGAQTLKNRIGIEQQLQQEQEAKQQESLQKKKAPIISKALQGEKLTEQEEKLLSPQEIMGIAKHNQAREFQEMKQKKESDEEKNIAQTAFNEMADLLKGGRLGLGSETKASIFGGKSAQDVGQFKSLAGALEGILVKMVSKGTLSNSRFKYIVEELLPKPNDRDATIKGKLKGLSTILGLDPSALEKQQQNSQSKEQSNERPGFVKMKDPQGVERWIPENVASQMQGSP